MPRKKSSKAKPKFDPPVRALGLHIAGLRAGIMEHNPPPDSLAQRVADLLAEAAYILLTPPEQQKDTPNKQN
jgi:hypothetical protein